MDNIVIIKLGAMGDVIRTIPLAKAMKKRDPDCRITWVTKKESLEFFEGCQYVDEVIELGNEVNEEFDKLYNFDIDDDATNLAIKINAKKKYGFYSEEGYASAFNFGAEYYLNTLFDDEIKKSNKKTYQEMMFELAELPYNKEKYNIHLNEEEKQLGEKFLEENNLKGKKIVGIHMGASSRWPSKVWDENKVKEFIMKAKGRGFEIILFGGPNEIEKHKNLASELEKMGLKIYRNNPTNTIKEFASLVNICDYMVCSDSLALHVSLALGKKTTGLFFCTSYGEVEDYGLLKKIISPMHEEFFPQKMDQYSKELTSSICVEDVLNSIEGTK